jgi:phycocyanobilin:ferredoxin oxidoreductase
MMNFRENLENTSEVFKRLIYEHGGVEIETEQFGWYNNRYVSDKFRMSHIERYTDDKLNVLHLTCFPQKWSEDPIFGFDIITTETRPLAAFCDWSPVLNDKTYESTYSFKKKYDLPEWATNIFSKKAIAIVPDVDEFYTICKLSIESFKSYLESLSNHKSDKINEIITYQNFYCDQQQQNKSTYNVLKAKLGEERAKHFMEKILFPKIESNER